MRLPGLPIDLPPALVTRTLSDLAAIARAAREAPERLDRLLVVGEDIAASARNALELLERLDARAGELIELGATMRALGERVDARGAEIVDRATKVVETGGELITVLPAFERALEMATPLEGAIERVGRLVDRMPGGSAARRRGATDPGPPTD
jgi:hypothetical protein